VPLERSELEGLLPHRGAMCLLDSVEAHDDTRVVCRAASHRSPANPLRVGDRLPALAAIEYAAQAMAAHGALRGEAGATPGRLVAVRDVRLHAATLDDVAADLEVAVDCVAADASGLVYAFVVSAGGRTLAEGRATVMLGVRKPS
jgi:predicted hotdog family 3-hydroxylacyl-ACP dehydratase